MSDQTTAAGRYARALYDVASKADALDLVHEELTIVVETFEAAGELARALTRPVAGRRRVARALDEAFTEAGFSNATKGLVAVMIDRGRLRLIDRVLEAYDALLNAGRGRVDATFVTSRPLKDHQREALVRALKKRTGKEIRLRVKEDPTLIGGVCVRLGNTVLDGSARCRLRQFNEAFK